MSLPAFASLFHPYALKLPTPKNHSLVSPLSYSVATLHGCAPPSKTTKRYHGLEASELQQKSPRPVYANLTAELPLAQFAQPYPRMEPILSEMDVLMYVLRGTELDAHTEWMKCVFTSMGGLV